MTSKIRHIKFVLVSILLTEATGAAWAAPTPRRNDPVESASAALTQHLNSFAQEQQALLQRQTLERSQSVLLATQPVRTPAGAPLGIGSLSWLSARGSPAATGIFPIQGRQGLLASYDKIPLGDPLAFLKGRSWTYDDAMGAIALLAQGRTQDARMVLSALQKLQAADGSIGFSYQIDSSYADTRVRTGTMAWIGYAMAFYQRVTGDRRFQSSAVAIAQKLKSLQLSSGSLQGGPDVHWVCTEHNVDAYFFFREMYRVTGQSDYSATANRIKMSLLTNHWITAGIPHFQQGIGDNTPALDANALGALFLNAIGQPAMAAAALNYVEATCMTQKLISGSTRVVTGYSPDANRGTVWVEGTMTVAVAYQRLGQTAKSASILQNVAGAIQDVWTAQGRWTGALPYAVGRYVNPDGDTFTEFESVPSTSWFLLSLSTQNGDPRFLDRG